MGRAGALGGGAVGKGALALAGKGGALGAAAAVAARLERRELLQPPRGRRAAAPIAGPLFLRSRLNYPPKMYYAIVAADGAPPAASSDPAWMTWASGGIGPHRPSASSRSRRSSGNRRTR